MARDVRAVDDVSFAVAAGEIYGLAGKSSSGKTTLIKTIAAATQPPLEVLGGSVTFTFPDGAIAMQRAGRRELAAIRWRHLSYIMQGSMSVLNPVRRVRHSFVDFAFRHIGQPMPQFLDTVRAHLQRLRLAPDVLDAYPHQLSGGMRQRVTIALATVCRPEFIIADEPTTALDVVVQKDVLAMIREIQRELGSSILFVTHDMAVHANLTDRLGIMYAGRLVEEGRTADIFRSARHPYTAHLIASLPRLGDTAPKARPRRHAAQPRRSAARLPLPSALPARDGRSAAARCRRWSALAPGHRVACFHPRARRMTAALLELDNVSRSYGGGLFSRRQVMAVRDVSLRLEAGRPEIFTVVGESGSGKTTLARMILGMVPPSARRDPLPGHRSRRPSAASARGWPSCSRSSRSSRTRSRPSTR